MSATLSSTRLLRSWSLPLQRCFATTTASRSPFNSSTSLMSPSSVDRHRLLARRGVMPELTGVQAHQSQPLQRRRWFSKDSSGDGGDDDNDENNESDTVASSSSPAVMENDLSNDNDNDDYSIEELVASFRDTSYFDFTEETKPDYSHMTNEELKDTSTIPGWELIHSPPKDKASIPRGALVGTVVSTKMQKTVNVAVDRFKKHRKYKKRLKYTKKFMAHDESEVANDGDLVMIVPCHKISKHKHFMLREIIRPKGQL